MWSDTVTFSRTNGKFETTIGELTPEGVLSGMATEVLLSNRHRTPLLAIRVRFDTEATPEEKHLPAAPALNKAAICEPESSPL